LNHRSLLAFAVGLLAFAGGPSSHAWSLEDISLSTPAVRGNLAVYFVRGSGTGAAAPLSLDEALGSGAAKINESDQRPITIENLSDRSIFIPLGTLIIGGLQDQVVAQSTIVPPGSGRMPLDVFCVDPFRSAARGAEDPTIFTSTGALFPSRMARLAMLASAAEPSKAIDSLRQTGVWWSIETLRAELSRVLGAPLETSREVAWTNNALRERRSERLLQARQSTWRTSLPLALESLSLAEHVSSYLDAGLDNAWAEAAVADVIGAVFAVNGRIEGAEIYQSHELFGRFWPNILRAYATQALAASDTAAGTPPPASDVQASLAAARAAAPRTPDSIVRETDAMISVETREAGGSWIARSFVPKLAAGESANTPDAMIANILQSGEVNGQALASLGDREVVLARDATSGRWSANVGLSFSEEQMRAFMRSMSEWRPSNGYRDERAWILVELAVGALWILSMFRGLRFAIARGIRRCCRALAGAAGQAFRLGAAVALAVIGLFAGILAAISYLVVGSATAITRLSELLAERAWTVSRAIAAPMPVLRPVTASPPSP